MRTAGIAGKRTLNMTLHCQTHRPLASTRLTPRHRHRHRHRLRASPSPRSSLRPRPGPARGETRTCSRTAGSRSRGQNAARSTWLPQRSLAYHHNNNVKVAKWPTMREMRKIYMRLGRPKTDLLHSTIAFPPDLWSNVKGSAQ